MMGLYLKLYNLINYAINFSVGIIGGFSKKFGEIRYNLPERKKNDFLAKFVFYLTLKSLISRGEETFNDIRGY